MINRRELFPSAGLAGAAPQNGQPAAVSAPDWSKTCRAMLRDYVNAGGTLIATRPRVPEGRCVRAVSLNVAARGGWVDGPVPSVPGHETFRVDLA